MSQRDNVEGTGVDNTGRESISGREQSLDAAEGSFLRRWSNRKLNDTESQSGPPSESTRMPAADTNSALANDEQQVSEVASAPPVLTDADMPPLESLDTSDNFSDFLSPGVSDELRRLALRKLFSAPAFNVCDGLDDYDEDFRSFAKLGDIITADMRHQFEQESERLEQKSQQQGSSDASPDLSSESADASVKKDECQSGDLAIDGEPLPREQDEPHTEETDL